MLAEDHVRPWEARLLTEQELDGLVWAKLYRIACMEGVSVEDVIFRAQLQEPMSEEDVDALDERLKCLIADRLKR